MKRPHFSCSAFISKPAREQLRREYEADLRRWQSSPGYLNPKLKPAPVEKPDNGQKNLL